MKFEKLFVVPLREKIISLEESEILFSNIEQIMDFNKQLLRELMIESKKAAESHNFGKIFLEHSDKLLEIYSPYCSNLILAQRMKNKLLNSNKHFGTFLMEALKNPITGKQDIKSFLIKPLQRLCKYPLLLKELLKFVPTRTFHSILSSAIKKLDVLIDSINTTMLASELQQPLLDIQDLFDLVCFPFPSLPPSFFFLLSSFFFLLSPFSFLLLISLSPHSSSYFPPSPSPLLSFPFLSFPLPSSLLLHSYFFVFFFLSPFYRPLPITFSLPFPFSTLLFILHVVPVNQPLPFLAPVADGAGGWVQFPSFPFISKTRKSRN